MSERELIKAGLEGLNREFHEELEFCPISTYFAELRRGECFKVNHESPRIFKKLGVRNYRIVGSDQTGTIGANDIVVLYPGHGLIPLRRVK
jgi:hypothetical protein